MIYQKTIAEPVRVDGIGIHSGKVARLTFKPAPENHGVYFVRDDIPGLPAVKAESRNVRATEMATSLGSDLFYISTVEHCMAAVGALGLDNLLIELSSPEIPICDGSAQVFFDALFNAGIIEQPALKKYMQITQPIYFGQGEKHAYVVPYNGLKVTCNIDFAHKAIGKQKIEIEVNEYSFRKNIARARTFGFMKDVEALKKKGLALGGSLDNAVVLDENGVVNPEGTRYQDEFVRHKALDAIGDLTMLGYPLLGHVVLHKSGHEVMHNFVQKIAQTKESYRIIELGSEPLSQGINPESLYLRTQVS